MKNLLLFAFVTLSVTALFVGCKKDSDDQPDMVELSLAFDFKVGDQDLVLGNDYEINGTMINFEAANYYVGGLSMIQENGTNIDLSQNYLLAGIGNTAAIQGNIEVSNLTQASFFVGVDATTNMQSEADFTSRPTGDALGLQDPAMHWNWMTGYKFLRIDGNTDTDADGTPDTGVAYHLGSAAMLKNFQVNKSIALKGGKNTITFTLDLEKVFSGVDLATELDTHTGNNLPLAEQIRDNLTTALSLQ